MQLKSVVSFMKFTIKEIKKIYILLTSLQFKHESVDSEQVLQKLWPQGMISIGLFSGASCNFELKKDSIIRLVYSKINTRAPDLFKSNENYVI